MIMIVTMIMMKIMIMTVTNDCGSYVMLRGPA